MQQQDTSHRRSLADMLAEIPEIGDAALTAKLRQEFAGKDKDHVCADPEIIKESLRLISENC